MTHVTATWPEHDRDMTDTWYVQKCDREVIFAPLGHDRGLITNVNETWLLQVHTEKPDRDITMTWSGHAKASVTWPWHDPTVTTTPSHDQNKLRHDPGMPPNMTDSWPWQGQLGHDQDTKATWPGHHRDKNRTGWPGDLLTACAVGCLIHLKPPSLSRLGNTVRLYVQSNFLGLNWLG